jgi:beta-lactamase regulating signal transducer with metallopeptidase domain
MRLPHETSLRDEVVMLRREQDAYALAITSTILAAVAPDLDPDKISEHCERMIRRFKTLAENGPVL